MKKIIVLFLVACIFVVSFGGCTEVPVPAVTGSVVSTAPPVTPSAAVTPAPPTPTITPAPPTPTPTPTPTPSPTPSPEPTPRMYSSYADMKSFDPATGIAEFDYWEMLKGKDAVKWLVENKGYTEAAAQAEVDGYADSEFITKNTNPQLRAIDMSTVPIRMMYKPNGKKVSGANPIATSYADFCTLYANYPKKVLNSNFYYITVHTDGSIKVDQVYWP